MNDDAGWIVISHLTKRFGPVRAVDGLSFTAAPGQVTGFLGPNGAGKTTTLRMLAGLVAPDAGAATISGRAYSALAAPGREAGLVLEACGLAAAGQRKVRGYSLGMRQRLALAAALLGDPAALILDEPANGLDPEGIAWLRGLLRDHARSGRTVLYSSHMLSEVEQLADQVVIMHRGRLAGQGTLAELTGGRGGLEQVFLSLTTSSPGSQP